MAKSLQEQLLQSGVARPKQAKKARREKAAKNKVARQQGQQSGDDAALQREIAAAEAAKREHDRALNTRQKEEREARERAHAVDQIISANRVAADGPPADQVDYSYTIGTRIRRIAVSDKQRRDLAAGRLGIVWHRGRASLLPRSAAERLAEKIPDQLWLVTTPAAEPDPEDPYAAFPVPDDLMW